MRGIKHRKLSAPIHAMSLPDPLSLYSNGGRALNVIGYRREFRGAFFVRDNGYDEAERITAAIYDFDDAVLAENQALWAEYGKRLRELQKWGQEQHAAILAKAVAIDPSKIADEEEAIKA